MTLTAASGTSASATKTSTSLVLRFTALNLREAFRRAASISVFDDGVGLDLDEPFGVNEADDLHDRVGGPHVAEEFAVDSRHALPVLYAREQDARAHNVGEPRAQTFEGARDYLEAAAGLRLRVARRDRLTFCVERRCARDRDKVAGAHRARDADERLVGRAA